MENAVLFLWDGWGILGRVVAFLAIVIFLLGLENLVVKLVADIQGWRRQRSEPTVEMLRRKQEDCIAILIPITAPTPLAGAMLARIKRTLDYENYMIFVGVREIDAQTLAAVRKEARKDSRIRLCPMELREAGSQARALNTLLASVRDFEHRCDVDFQTYVLQGPETIAHPLSLKLVNWHSEFASIVQLPVLTMPRGGLPLTGGAGLDDLGEHHAREMLLRARTVHNVPVLATGLALRRDAVWALRHHGDVFDTASESPVFDAVQLLNERGHLTSYVWQRDADRKVIAVEELSPRRWRDAAQSRARRLLDTALGDRRELGSAQGSLWMHFFNYRGRRMVAIAATLGCALLAVLAGAGLLLAGHYTPGFETMPALIESPWVLMLLAVNAGFLGASVIERLALTARVRGLRAAMLLPLNLVTSVLITTQAALIASRKAKALVQGEGAPASRKPERASGSYATLLSGKPRITDILVHSGTLSKEEAKTATSYSRRTGRRLSLALQDLRLADGTAIAKALADKLGIAFGHIDGPLDSYTSVFLQRHEAERFCAFAERAPDGGIDVHIAEDYSVREWRELRAALRRAGVHRPNFKAAPLSEIAYAIRFAGSAQEMAIEQAIAVSLMDGPIPEGTERDIRRQLRAPYRRLEDLIVERGLIQPRRMRIVKRRIGAEGLGLEDMVCKDRRIPPFTLAETVREFNEWRPAIAPLTATAPLARFEARKPTLVDPRLAA